MFRLYMALFIGLIAVSTQALAQDKQKCLSNVDAAEKFLDLHGVSGSTREENMNDLRKAAQLCNEGKVKEGNEIVSRVGAKDVYDNADHLGQANEPN